MYKLKTRRFFAIIVWSNWGFIYKKKDTHKVQIWTLLSLRDTSAGMDGSFEHQKPMSLGSTNHQSDSPEKHGNTPAYSTSG